MPTASPRHSNFNAQHSPLGAFMSFTCGHHGSKGGFGLQIGRPGSQEVYVGVKDGGRFERATLRCLPFFSAAQSSTLPGAAFQPEQADAGTKPKTNINPIAEQHIQRDYGWATDGWQTDDIHFSIYTPFASIPDPSIASLAELRQAIVPAIVAELCVDNRSGSHTKTGFFALQFADRGWAPMQMPNGVVGFRHRSGCGVLGQVICDRADNAHRHNAEPQLFCRFDLERGLNEPTPHLLASCPGLAFEVPAGEQRTLRLALGCFLSGIVTQGIQASYLYTRCFASLEDVLTFRLDHADEAIAKAARLDAQLRESRLSSDQQFLLAHATRSYYGSTQLLDAAGAPLWIVNEGEYCMLNTLDLAIDQVFWELRQNPWVVRNLLEQFATRYAFTDDVKTRDGTVRRGGISFCHDMGAYNCFTPAGTSSYELPDLTDCFSHMTAEQLCNWSLLAATYYASTGDVQWLRHGRGMFRECLDSLIARSDEYGIIALDSTRCGRGAEITTYDSLDHSLAQTRNNAYMAVKSWASHGGLSMLLRDAGDDAGARQAVQIVERIAKRVTAMADEHGIIPAVFEPDSPGYQSRILPAVEGLLYPLQWRRTRHGQSAADAMLDTASGKALVAALAGHATALLKDPGRHNLFSDGGIRLSSTSNNSWMSKIAIFQHVARELLEMADDAELLQTLRESDAAHVGWQINGSAYWACCDQIVSGQAGGSRYYPRIVSTCLWLDEH
ncbi:MAG: glycoside hydrolase family 52 protein [Tepidisphaeraceae bacterium]